MKLSTEQAACYRSKGKRPSRGQVGGDHYKDSAIEPIDYIVANELTYMEGNVVKYVSRHRRKNGAEDVRKAMQYLEFILEKEYGERY